MQYFAPITQGKFLMHVKAGGFILTETKHRPHLRLVPHSHKEPNIVCVLDGSFTETIDRRTYQCLSRTILVKAPEEVPNDSFESVGARCLIIEGPSHAGASANSWWNLLYKIRQLETGSLAEIIRQIRLELRLNDRASVLAIEGLVLELMAKMTRRKLAGIGKDPRWLDQAKDFIDSQFMEPISLARVAEVVGLHPAHFARAFRKHFHCTVGDYVRRLRLEYAASKLTADEHSLGEIAVAAGFYDQSHFTNSFKLYNGVTPSEYRAKTRKRITKRR